MPCLCSAIRDLADDYDQAKAASLASELNLHLGAIRRLLAKFKPLSRDIGYQVVPNNPRTSKIFAIQSVDHETPAQICHAYGEDLSSFFTADGGLAYQEVRRRLACIVIYLRSTQSTEGWVSPDIADLVKGQKLQELRYAGRKYIKMGRRLGGVGSTLWLPTHVPSSTYERYLNMDDDDAFNHLNSLGTTATDWNAFVKRLLSVQLKGPVPSVLQASLYDEYGDLFPDCDRVVLLLAALGGSNIPVDLLKSVQQPQNRWCADGEIVPVHTKDFPIPPDLVDLLRDEDRLARVSLSPSIQQSTLEDGTAVWTVQPETMAALEGTLSPTIKETWASVGLGLVCYACPPCYEGKVNWTRDKKKAIWTILDNNTSSERITPALRTHVLDALLFFSERDLYKIRQTAVTRAKSLLVKTMPFYYHASVALFESIMLRLEGNFDASNSLIKNFLQRNQTVSSRCDNALRGRLHVSWIENKIHMYESNVSAVMYDWEGILPLSTFEIEVTRRLQGTAAKYFHSIGDFLTARASLEQHLSLTATQPIRQNTRLLITTKLAEIHCELGEFDRAQQLVRPEIEHTADVQRRGRPFRRLSMVSAEADMGQGSLDTAEATLRQLEFAEPPELDDLNDQVLHMRRLLLVARLAHERSRFGDALQLWRLAFEKMRQLSIFSSRHPWTMAVIALSMAHAQLGLGDVEGARESWALALEISKKERCEYVIPTLATAWASKIVGDVYRQQDWPFRMMLPGGRPDMILF